MQDIQNAVNSLIERIKTSDKTKILTEEETKQAFILPFLHALGYNVFDTNVIKPEYTADIGTKKGEKVDYAILRNGSPIVLIEAKHHKESLDNHKTQLIRYFHACAGKFSDCRFAILTNGLEYRFFTDTQKENVMDTAPFLTINLENPKNRDLVELQRFAKDNLNVEEIKKVAKANLYYQQIQQIFKNEVENPSDDFVEFFARKILNDEKRITQKIKDEFKEPVKKTLKYIISDLANEQITKIKNEIAEAQKADSKDLSEDKDDEIITTEEELQGFYIVKSLFADREDITLDKITHKDTKFYFGILFDNKTTRWICRLYLNGGKKFFVLPCEQGEKRIDINDTSELYKYKTELNAALDMRVKK